MRCFTILFSFALAVSSASLLLAADDPVTIEGKVTAVTVYQGQALVTRTVKVDAAQGLAEVVVTNLPSNILPASLYAEPESGVEIRSVRYRVRPVKEDVREEVRELMQQRQEYDDALAENRRQRELLREQIAYMQKLEQFTTVTANQELKSGVLNAETLKELTKFNFETRAKVASDELSLAKNERQLLSEKSLVERKLKNISSNSARTVREAIVFVNVVDGNAKGLRLRYLVSNATWSPSYNLRASTDRDEVLMEYNASIQQMSGEDWTNVDMTLSTATPSLLAQAPSLDPLVVKLGHAPMPQLAQQMNAAPGQSDKFYEKAKGQLEEQRRQIAKGRGQIASKSFSDSDQPSNGLFDFRKQAPAPSSAPAPPAGGGGFGGGLAGVSDGSSNGPEESISGRRVAREREASDRELNMIANQIQILDYNTASIELKKDTKPTLDGEGVSVSYHLDSRMTLPSRSDRQLIQISAHQMKGDFYRLAIPVLTSNVYEEVRLANDSDMVLLAGPSSTFLGDEFVGRGEVPTVAVGESFNVGLGIDTSLRAFRELVDKKERIQGGNRVVDFTYEMKLENFSGSEVQVRLLDRMPTAKDSAMKLTLVTSDKPVSEDREYQMKGLDEGILRWDVTAPAKATGVDKLSMKYTMQIEYDKQLSIVGLPVKP